MQPIYLTDSEIQAITGKRRNSARARVLDFLGIPYKPRADGVIIISRQAYEAAMSVPAKRRRASPQPDYSAIHGTKTAEP